jgi:hypothetical protein
MSNPLAAVLSEIQAVLYSVAEIKASRYKMNKPYPLPSNERIMETMIELTGLSKSHRVIVAGSNALDSILVCMTADILA